MADAQDETNVACLISTVAPRLLATQIMGGRLDGLPGLMFYMPGSTVPVMLTIAAARSLRDALALGIDLASTGQYGLVPDSIDVLPERLDGEPLDG